MALRSIDNIVDSDHGGLIEGDLTMVTRSMTDMRLHPLIALGAIKRLMNEPGDTRQVFVILRAMRGRSGLRMFRRFRASGVGAAILRERRCLLEVLQDHAALARLPAGSVGRVYWEFMTAEELSAAGLIEAGRSVDPEDMPAEERFFQDRMRVLHDVGHVVTGYGRDPLGELCLLAFNFAQSWHLGMGLIVLMALARAGDSPEGKMARAAVKEAWRAGRRAAWLGGEDWENLLGEQLGVVRERLRIVVPARYVAEVAVKEPAL